MFGTINGVALVVGLLCGGLIVDYLGPFSIFTLTTVPGAASFVLLMKFYPNRPAKAAPAIDFPGIALLGGCLVCLLGWCSLGGIVFQRGSALGVALLAMGLLLGVLLFWREKQAPDPLIDLTLFRRRHYAVSFAVQMLIPPMVYLCSSVLVLFGQSVMGLSATASRYAGHAEKPVVLCAAQFSGRLDLQGQVPLPRGLCALRRGNRGRKPDFRSLVLGPRRCP